jgi:hypothetical protein
MMERKGGGHWLAVSDAAEGRVGGREGGGKMVCRSRYCNLVKIAVGLAGANCFGFFRQATTPFSQLKL